MDGKIATFDKLKTLLTKAYWIEKRLEETAKWYGYLQAKSNHAKDVLFQITREAENHKSVLVELINTISDFNLEDSLKKLNFGKPQFKFEQKNDKDIFMEILANIEMIDEIYGKLYNTTNSELIKNHWIKSDFNNYFNTLSWLKNQEKDLKELLEPFVIKELEKIH